MNLGYDYKNVTEIKTFSYLSEFLFFLLFADHIELKHRCLFIPASQYKVWDSPHLS